MLRNLTIKQKLIIIMLIPLIVVLFLSAKLAYEDFSNKESLSKINKIVYLSTKIGTFVHETQKERGMTSGFLGSKGEKFSSELLSQREKTDEQKKVFLSYLNELDFNEYNSSFKTEVEKGLLLLNDMNNIRSQVSSQTIKASDAIAYYTNMNASFLNIIASAINISQSAILTQKLTTYMNFLLAKERAGIERAVGSNTFAKNEYGEGMRVKFNTLVAAQDAYLDTFLKLADEETKQFYMSKVSGESVNEVNKMRAILLSKTSDFNVDAKYWFDTITQKINLLKEVEVKLEEQIIAEAQAEKSDTLTEIYIFAFLAILGIVITLVLGRLIAYSIIKDLDELKIGLNGFFAFLNHEKKNLELVQVRSRDEIGQMSLLINQNIENTRLNIVKDEELIKETISVADQISKGHLSTRINKNTNNPQLNDLRNIINTMLGSLQGNMEMVMKVLTSYSNLDYKPKIENNNLEGTLSKLCNDINGLRDAITQSLVANKRNGMILSQNADTLTQSLGELNNAATSQAASLEETAASLEELTSNLKQNTTSTIEMANYGSRVKNSVSTGQELAIQTDKAMEDINNQTSSITEAISIIDQIAFQTNILSLNAAVEAATAGEAGKGFAVVAGEVRNLASRSAEAAKEIKNLVDSAQEKTNFGKKIASDMINGYNELNQDISKTIELIESVASASKEQEAGIVQINDAVNELDQITQNNAKNTAIADEIARQTHKISKIIVDDADAKDFEGKHEIKLRKQTLNENFSGVEKRSVEKRAKEEDSHFHNHSNAKKSTSTISKPKVAPIATKSAPVSKSYEPKKVVQSKPSTPTSNIITSKKSSDDEWESF